MIDLKSVNKLFERDVLFSLTNFTLWASMTGLHVLHNLLSMLSSQCLYSLDVNWCVSSIGPLPETSNILFNTFQQLKGPVPIELELFLESNVCFIRAVTVPRMDKSLCVYSYQYKNTMDGSK